MTGCSTNWLQEIFYPVIFQCNSILSRDVLFNESGASACRQGDVGMEGPRGGVGAPGETVRNSTCQPGCGEKFKPLISNLKCAFYLT